MTEEEFWNNKALNQIAGLGNIIDPKESDKLQITNISVGNGDIRTVSYNIGRNMPARTYMGGTGDSIDNKIVFSTGGYGGSGSNYNDYVIKQPATLKFHEDKILTEMLEYIKKTYTQHYATDDGIQAIDIWRSLGSDLTSCRDLAMKYLMRFGRKEGADPRLDLKKACHFIILMLDSIDQNQNKDTVKQQLLNEYKEPETI